MALKRGTVKLESNYEKWHDEYIHEATFLKEKLKDYILEIEHVGWTSIKGLIAKPIIDILIVINSFNDIPKIENILKEYGYLNHGPQGVADREFFTKGSEEARTHHIHFTTPKSDTYYDLKYFKRYLIEHPKYIEEYNSLKQKLASIYANDRPKYTAGKHEFISNIITLAKEKYHD